MFLDKGSFTNQLDHLFRRNELHNDAQYPCRHQPHYKSLNFLFIAIYSILIMVKKIS